MTRPVNCIAEYPIWDSINRTLTGKFVDDSQKLFMMSGLNKTAKNLKKRVIPGNAPFLGFFLTERSK